MSVTLGNLPGTANGGQAGSGTTGGTGGSATGGKGGAAGRGGGIYGKGALTVARPTGERSGASCGASSVRGRAAAWGARRQAKALARARRNRSAQRRATLRIVKP